MAGGDDGVLVDLVEVDDQLGAAGSGEPDPAPPPDQHARVRGRAHALAAAGVVVVLGIVATIGGAALLDERRARERRDVLAAAGVPVVELAEPLEEAWRTEGGQWPVVVRDDVVVVQGYGVGSTVAMVALDTATGQERWARDTTMASCRPWAPTWTEDVDQMAVRGPWGALYGDDEPAWVVCQSGEVWQGQPRPGAVTTTEVVDLADGRVLAQVDLPGAAVVAILLGEDAIVTTVDADGRMLATRVGMLTGDVAWTVDAGTGAMDDYGGFVGAYPMIVGGTLQLGAPDGGLRYVELETGEPAEPDSAEGEAPPFAEAVLPDGSVAASYYEVVDAGGGYATVTETTTVTGLDGVERFSVPGSLWSPTYSDGSLADRVVVLEGEGPFPVLVAVDVLDGTELWRQRVDPWDHAVLEVGGVAVTAGEHLAGVDLRTGEQRWRADGLASSLAPVTDGSRVLALVTHADGPALAAFDIASGTEAWRLSTPRGAWSMLVVGGGVLVSCDEVTVFYRAP